ncbi:hypothetical protein HNP84_005713 [Thermocatellispora tengchongensis]|uniref:Uncharacterized protein n=1 Tax=Thermocatellispora tengchongensis TaxID=1073253 RepID=A0A840PAD8_9ACTN|nr:hypothetical protein [Thermocatellispora tengchongensis]MBB5135969.1 hypothetical protein [Thermocatellispora tengchongensis]
MASPPAMLEYLRRLERRMRCLAEGLSRSERRRDSLGLPAGPAPHGLRHPYGFAFPAGEDGEPGERPEEDES